MFDCRCATPAAPPVRAHNALTSCAAWPHRCCNLDGKDAVDMENGCITEQEMCANLEYLVLGHFERKQGDTKGTHTMLWLAIADFDKLGRVQRGGRPHGGYCTRERDGLRS